MWFAIWTVLSSTPTSSTPSEVTPTQVTPQPAASGHASSTPSVAATPPEPAPQNTTQSPAEAQLIERCRGGDLEAFDELMSLHQNRIFNLCYWILGDRDEAADAAQDAFVRAWRAMPTFRAESALGTWLHRIAVNVCLDAKARRKKTPLPYSTFESEDDDGSITRLDPPDKSDTPEQSLARRERRDAVLQALAALPEHHRAVIVLFDMQGHTYEDAAEVLHLPMGTLKSRLNRARTALRQALEGQRELFED
ncbi:MAG: polymerase sigma-70 factor, subfamily [Abditibacteriota bacterium]|nr:polymerase sigma-70 factor, subfamily [Abditibacteriota bacterium]